MSSKPAEDLDIENRGALSVVTLQRHQALNALTCEMRAGLAELLPKVARDPMIYAIAIRSASDRVFSVGGDVREIIGLAQRDMAAARKAFADEYHLNWQHECFSKPTIALINGIVMGSGVGITAYGTHRVAGEGYRFSMPETAIGLFPDVGVSYLLSRMPHHIGLYLGLTGRRISRAAAFDLGLVTHCIAAAEFDGILAEVADVQPVDPVLDSRHEDPGPSELAPVAGTIAQCFSAASVEQIIERLDAITGQDRDWAQKVAGELRARSPIAVKVTHRHIRAARDLDLRQTLLVDCRLACGFLQNHDFSEGVRAQLIDKDGEPRWQPANLVDVTSDMVNEYFTAVPDDTFSLPTRQELQTAYS